MGNRVENIGGIAKEILYQLVNNLSILKGVKRQYSDEFAVDGAKPGDILKVKYLDNVPVSRGKDLMVKELKERTVPIEITENHQYQSGIEFNSLDYKLSIEEFVEKRNVEQIAAKMADEMEQDVANMAYLIPNMVGTLGTTPGTAGGSGLTQTTAPNIFGNARKVLTDLGAPSIQRTMALDTTATNGAVNAMVALQNPSGQLTQQFRKGQVGAGPVMNFDFVENVNIPNITTGTRSNGTLQVGVADGDSTITVTGLGALGTVKRGEHLTIAGAYAVNPLNQQARSFFRMFVVLEDVTANASGVAILSISPTIKLSNPENLVNGSVVRRFPSLPLEVNGNVNALPIAGAAVTFSGAASTAGVLNMGFQRDAIVCTSVGLPMMGGAEKCAVMTLDGISLRLWKDNSIDRDKKITRIDAVMVPTLVRSDLATVVFG